MDIEGYFGGGGGGGGELSVSHPDPVVLELDNLQSHLRGNTSCHP